MSLDPYGTARKTATKENKAPLFGKAEGHSSYASFEDPTLAKNSESESRFGTSSPSAKKDSSILLIEPTHVQPNIKSTDSESYYVESESGDSKDSNNNKKPETKCEKIWASLLSPNSLRLLFLIFTTIFVSAFDWVLWKRTLNKFHSKTSNETYSFFVLQLYIILECTLAFGACLIQLFVTKKITPEMRAALPLRMLAGISALDTISMLLSSLSAAVVAGHVQTLLNQMSLPILMIFSLLLLAARYSKLQYLGAFLIVSGAVLAAIPNMTSTNADGRENKAWGLLTYSIGLIPFALSNVFREIVFRDRPKIDLFYLMTWSLSMQFVFGWVCVPILAIPAFGGVPIRDIPDQITLGYDCLIGREVPGLECHIGTKPIWFLLGYVVLNFIVSILRLLLIKTASAVILQVTNAMALLTSNIIFCSAVFMGSDKEHFNIFDAFGLVIVVAGFVLFRIAQYQLQNEALLEEDTLKSDSDGSEKDSSSPVQSSSGVHDSLADASRNATTASKKSRGFFGKSPLLSRRSMGIGLEDTSMSMSTGTGISRHAGHSRLLERDDDDNTAHSALRKAAVSAAYGTAYQTQPLVLSKSLKEERASRGSFECSPIRDSDEENERF